MPGNFVKIFKHLIMNFKKMLLPVLALVVSVVTYAQNADEVIAKYISAKGGADNLRKIESMVMKGNLNINGMMIPVTITTVNNTGMRVDFSFNGMSGYTIITKDAGWDFNPFAGQTKAEPMTAEDVKSKQDALDVRDDLLDYASKGTSVNYMGTEDVEGTECHKLQLTLNGGKQKTYFIDTDGYMLVKSSEKTTVNGQETESNTMYSNYKMVGDVLFAHNISADMGPIEMESIELNTTVDTNLFKPE